jgi:hypothetical protein
MEKQMKKSKWIAGLVITLLAGCGEQSPSITPTLDRTGVPISVTVQFYNTSAELEEAYRQVNNLSSRIPVPEQWGFASWNEWIDPDGNPVEPLNAEYQCTIHTFMPRTRNDQHVTTLGHELLHCVWGSWHP